MVKVPLQWESGRLIPLMDNELADFPGEIWKDIPEAEDYQVSSHGRIKTKQRIRFDSNGIAFQVKARIRKLTIRRNGIHISVVAPLKVDGKQVSYMVSRLVYSAFVTKFSLRDHTRIVIKKDGNALNCHYKNLELITVSTNILDGFAKKGRKSGFEHKKKPVNQYDSLGNFVKRYDTVNNAGKALGIDCTALCAVIKRPNFRCHGYYWRYGEPVPKIDVAQFDEKRNRDWRGKKSGVIKIAANGRVMRIFESIAEAARAMSVDINQMRRALVDTDKKIKGYRFKYTKG